MPAVGRRWERAVPGVEQIRLDVRLVRDARSNRRAALDERDRDLLSDPRRDRLLDEMVGGRDADRAAADDQYRSSPGLTHLAHLQMSVYGLAGARPAMR